MDAEAVLRRVKEALQQDSPTALAAIAKLEEEVLKQPQPIGTIQSLLAEVREALEELTEAQKQSRQRDRRIRQLERELRDTKIDTQLQKRKAETLREIIQLNLVSDNNLYWLGEDDARIGPFCPACWDKDKKLVKVETTSENSVRCKRCLDRTSPN